MRDTIIFIIQVWCYISGMITFSWMIGYLEK